MTADPTPLPLFSNFSHFLLHQKSWEPPLVDVLEASHSAIIGAPSPTRLLQAFRVTVLSANTNPWSPVYAVQFAALRLYEQDTVNCAWKPLTAAHEIFLLPRLSPSFKSRIIPPNSRTDYPYLHFQLERSEAAPTLSVDINGYQAVPTSVALIPSKPAAPIWLAHARFCGAFDPATGALPKPFARARAEGLMSEVQSSTEMMAFFSDYLGAWTRAQPHRPRTGPLLSIKRLQRYFRHVW